MEQYVTRAELNGSLVRLEQKIDSLRVSMENNRDREDLCRENLRAEVMEATKGMLPTPISIVLAVLSSSVTGLLVATIR